MEAFLQALHNHMERPDSGHDDPSAMIDLLKSLDYIPEEWEKYKVVIPEHYSRNLVSSKDFVYDCILLCWLPGQKSAVHDHKESGCWMRVLQGNLTETRYHANHGNKDYDDPSQWNKLEEKDSKEFSAGDVFYINNDLGVHRVVNTGTELALSLHIYSPPITACSVWLPSGEPQMFKSSFHSVFGLRLPAHVFKPAPDKKLGGKFWPLRNQPVIKHDDSLSKDKKLTENGNGVTHINGNTPSEHTEEEKVRVEKIGEKRKREDGEQDQPEEKVSRH